MNGEITLNFLEFFGASEATVDCFQRLERSQNSPVIARNEATGDGKNFTEFFDGVVLAIPIK